MVHAFERVDDWRAGRARTGHMLLALDYDGTLAPIVPVPAEAQLLPAARAALSQLLQRADTTVAVVSGRGLDDVRARVAFDQIHYAGNHGLEIDGPGVHRMHAEAEAASDTIRACVDLLRDEFEYDDGVLVEDKRVTLSVHFRQVTDPALEHAIRARVEKRCSRLPGLRLTEGKKVVEVRPDVDWHKGRATRFLMDTLLTGSMSQAPVVYIGDDRTDEDAFRALDGQGEGVLVTDDSGASSHASAWVRSPEEVAILIAHLAQE